MYSGGEIKGRWEWQQCVQLSRGASDPVMMFPEGVGVSEEALVVLAYPEGIGGFNPPTPIAS